jgi:squalene cyclase
MLVALHFLGRLDPPDATAGARWLCSQQRDDGSFANYPHARQGHVGATASALAAWRVAGLADDAEPVRRAHAFLDTNGGVARVIEALNEGDVAALFLALAGLLEAKQLPRTPLSFGLVPPLRHYLERRFNGGILMTLLQIGLIVRRLQGDWGPHGDQQGPLASAAGRHFLHLLDAFQNSNGSWWNGVTQWSALTLVALWALGLPADHPRLARGLAALEQQAVRDEHGLRFRAFGCGVWLTAFNLRALLACRQTPDEDAIGRAARWLLDSQSRVPQPHLNNPRRDVPRIGGWGFQRCNETLPDCDDTGMVLNSLGLVLDRVEAPWLDDALVQRLRQAIVAGRDWLLGMQNPEGGWASFVHALPAKAAGPMMKRPASVRLDSLAATFRVLLSPPVELGEPATEDLTARVLLGLGAIGYTARAPEVEQALHFLQAQQCPDGAFWARWTTNYLSGTSYVLLGLSAVGADLEAPWVRRAVGWLLDRQNADGGWGETPESYRHPERAGVGPSLPPLTGLVLSALIEVGAGQSPAVGQGIRYLLERQRADGTWSAEDYVFALVPPDTFYDIPASATYHALEALGKYLALKENWRTRHHPERLATIVPPPRWKEDLLDRMRGQGDPHADNLIQTAFAGDGVRSSNELLSRLRHNDDPLPPGLPPGLRSYFVQTGKLPEWAEPGKIALAQALFRRQGWEIALGLFCSALPQGYAAAPCARLMCRTSGLTLHVRQRIFETAQFLFDVLDEGALGPTGRGIRAAQKVRLMHAAIRHLLGQPRGVAAPGAAVPINQEDMAGTLLLFSVVTLDALKKLNRPVRPEEADAWLHTWTVIGSLLGVSAELLPRSLPEGEALLAAFRRRHWQPSPEGRQLAQVLVEMMQGYYPQALAGTPVALIRHLAGARCADLLGLPPTSWYQVLTEGGVAVAAALLQCSGLKQVGELLGQGLGKIVGGMASLQSGGHLHWGELLEQLGGLLRSGQPEASARPLQLVFHYAVRQLMRGIVSAHRDGKDAPFRIPSSLLETVSPN